MGSAPTIPTENHDRLWPSLEGRLAWDQEVVGSNPSRRTHTGIGKLVKPPASEAGVSGFEASSQCHAAVAQSGERCPVKAEAAGSKPVGGAGTGRGEKLPAPSWPCLWSRNADYESATLGSIPSRATRPPVVDQPLALRRLAVAFNSRWGHHAAIGQFGRAPSWYEGGRRSDSDFVAPCRCLTGQAPLS